MLAVSCPYHQHWGGAMVTQAMVAQEHPFSVTCESGDVAGLGKMGGHPEVGGWWIRGRASGDSCMALLRGLAFALAK